MIHNMPIILNVLLMLYVLSATTVTRAHPTLEDLDKYEIHSLSTYSHMNNARNGRKLMQSRGERKLSYEFEAFGRVLALELTRDDELFASEYKHYFVVPKDDGSHEYIVDEKVDTKCHYKAIIKDDPQSIGRISLCGPGMRALFKHSEIGQFHIEPMDDKGDEHVVYRALDVKKSDKRGCGVDDSFRKNRPRGLLEESDDMKSTPNDKHNHIHDHDHNHNHDHHHSHEEKAAEQAHERRELVNLPDKLIRLVVVNDYLRFQQMGNKVHTHAASLVASMDSIYSTFGGTYTFDLQIVAMFTYSIKDPYSVTISSSGYPLASNILNPFSDWANNRGASFPVQFSHAMLFSGYNFDSTTIGLAWLGTTCTTWAQSIVQTVALKDSIIALAAAHELGHNLGMDHDSSSYPCYGTNSPYIMDPSVSNTGVASWSQCSVDRMKSVLEGDQRKYDIFGYPACMEKCFIGDPNPPSGCVGVATRNISIPECGDGFREGSEECDCPNKDCSVIDPCCDGATCKLKVGSACSLLDPCCSSSCQIVTDTTQICRASTGECDIADKCDGVNAKCPPDDFLQIGSPCTLYSKPGTCYNKDCVSHWGMCYEYGGPGYYESDCPSRNNDDGDAACGNIHCKKANSFGCTYYTTVWVKDGIQCGAAKACLNQVCTDYSSFPNQPTSTVSPTVPTQSPTKAPTKDPTKTPTKSPTNAPIKTPTKNPTNNPSKNPTTTPTTVAPTLSPTTPTLHPTATPTTSPTFYPTLSPTSVPTTTSPTSPTPSPSFSPSLSPSASPTVSPTTAAPTSNPTTPNPTSTPSASPTASPTTAAPTFNPTTPNPTTAPSLTPSTSPTTSNPSTTPTITPSSAPSSVPTTKPTKSPTKVPTTKPTNLPSNPPTTSSPISSPTKSPLTLCKYDTKKKCKKDSKCLWLKKICTVSECALLTSKTDCIANLKCSWKKNVCKLK